MEDKAQFSFPGPNIKWNSWKWSSWGSWNFCTSVL